VQGGAVVAGEFGDQRGDGVGRRRVFGRGANVGERRAVRAGDDVEVCSGKVRPTQHRVVGQQGMELPAVRVQQGSLRQPRPFGRGDEVNFGGQEGNIAMRQRVERLGDDLRRQAGNAEQDAARKVGGGEGIHAAGLCAKSALAGRHGKLAGWVDQATEVNQFLTISRSFGSSDGPIRRMRAPRRRSISCDVGSRAESSQVSPNRPRAALPRLSSL